MNSSQQWMFKTNSVEPFSKDHPTGHNKVVCQDRWSLVTCSVILKCRSFCHKSVVFQDRWSLTVVISQDRFHCTKKNDSKLNANSSKTRTPSIGLTYSRGLSEELKPIFKHHRIGAFHKPLRSLLVHPKTKPRATSNVGRLRYTRNLAWAVVKLTWGKQEEHSVAG